MTAGPLIYEGTAWCFGDGIAVDGDLMPLEFALSRETRPEVLREHVMSGIDPDFAERAKPNDIIFAGRRFAQGNPHIQGLLGIAALGLGLVVESIPRGSYRNAVNAAVPLLAPCPGVLAIVESGHQVRVDFDTGLIENNTTGKTAQFDPLPGLLRRIILAGGWQAMVKQRIAGTW